MGFSTSHCQAKGKSAPGEIRSWLPQMPRGSSFAAHGERYRAQPLSCAAGLPLGGTQAAAKRNAKAAARADAQDPATSPLTVLLLSSRLLPSSSVALQCCSSVLLISRLRWPQDSPVPRLGRPRRVPRQFPMPRPMHHETGPPSIGLMFSNETEGVVAGGTSVTHWSRDPWFPCE